MRKDYFLIPNHLFGHNLSCKAVVLYALLSRHADENGQVYESLEDLIQGRGISMIQAKRLLTELEKSGLISWNKSFITLPDLKESK
jgi:hypothetical protein